MQDTKERGIVADNKKFNTKRRKYEQYRAISNTGKNSWNEVADEHLW